MRAHGGRRGLPGLHGSWFQRVVLRADHIGRQHFGGLGGLRVGGLLHRLVQQEGREQNEDNAITQQFENTECQPLRTSFTRPLPGRENILLHILNT